MKGTPGSEGGIRQGMGDEARGSARGCPLEALRCGTELGFFPEGHGRV